MKYLIPLLIFVLSIPLAKAGDKPFRLIVHHKNFASAEAHGASPIQKNSSDNVSVKVDGTEKSECRDYGRSSSAEANANVKILRQSDTSVSLSLTSIASAFGGHYRTCARCYKKNCIAIFGNDTIGKSSATAETIVTIEFDREFPETDYLLQISNSTSNAIPVMKLTDELGKEIPLRSKEKQPQVLHGKPGSLYYLSVRLPISAANKGGCCDDKKNSSALVDISILKAPILDALGQVQPYIRGGEETKSYKNVGAILINGRLHCTGTIVGNKTILTAAHCLHGYEDQLDDMSFLLGSNLLQPEFGPVKIQAFKYPKGIVSGFKFNPKTLEDDIGLVYLENSLDVKLSKLHTGEPTWDDILENKNNLIFVGFGYDVIDDQEVGSGIKREAAWTINGVRNRRVTFNVPDKNTCKGDSGGPAFIILARSLIQVGITSGGDSGCSLGFETRIDAFSGWLQGEIL